MKPTKAYLLSESHAGFGFRVSPVIVLARVAGTNLATVALLNVTAERAWIPTLGASFTVRVSDLASTRLRVLAKIAVRLLNVETMLSANLIAPPAPPPPAPTRQRPETQTTPQLTHAAPHRRNVPWWKRDDE